MIRPFVSVLAFAPMALSGCASSLSGLGGTESYGCKAPEGVLCMSVSGVYANSTQGPQRPTPSASAKSSSGGTSIYGASSVALPRSATPGAAGDAIRSNPRLLRVWIAPWQDSDGDLHEDGYVHMVVDTGRWLIEHVRPAPRGSVDGVAPPLPHAADPAPAKTPLPDATPGER